MLRCRCRCASYRISAAVTAAFSDSTGALHRDRDALVGRVDEPSRRARVLRRRSDSASGPVRSASNSASPSRGTVATIRQPCRRASSIASCGSRSTAIGRRSALPIEPRSAFQPNGSATAPAATTPGGASRLGDAHDRAEVAGILHVAGDDDERRGRAGTDAARGPAGDPRARRSALGDADRADRRHDRRGASADLDTAARRAARSARRCRRACQRRRRRPATWRSAIRRASASATRCAPSSSSCRPRSPRAASRKRATSGFWRLVMRLDGHRPSVLVDADE